MKAIKTLKSLYKYTHENPSVDVVYISMKLANYITLLEHEYIDSITRGVPMKPKHQQDYWLFNDCIVANGTKFLVEEAKNEINFN